MHLSSYLVLLFGMTQFFSGQVDEIYMSNVISEAATESRNREGCELP